MKRIKTDSKLKNLIINYTTNNAKEYILVVLIFIIGMSIGIMAIHNYSESNGDFISSYINQFIYKFENADKINHSKLVIESIKNNLFLAIMIWIVGTTIIGMPIAIGGILFRGFCLGYTISGICFALGIGKGMLFCITALFLQNLLFIPALLTLGVSSIKLYKSIINDRRKENIKISIVRHTIISILMSIVLIISSIAENEIAIRVLKIIINFWHPF